MTRPRPVDPPPQESRSRERLRAHFEIERELAQRLRTAPPEQRRALYGEIYRELLRRVPDHPQRARAEDPAARAERVIGKLAIVRHLAPPAFTFLEIGAGDGSLALAVAAHAVRVYAVDVSDDTRPAGPVPDNFSFLVAPGLDIGVPAGSIDLAYSDQLLEHLHPEDALQHARDVLRVLRPGGRYLCITPHPLSGPHDISRYFSTTPQGLHLREYATRDLRALFKRAGFARVRNVVSVRSRLALAPSSLLIAGERLLTALPADAGRRVARRQAFENLAGMVLATAPGA